MLLNPRYNIDAFSIPSGSHFLSSIFNVPGTYGVVLDPSLLSTMWQDAAKTTPVTTDGDPIGAMEDALGSGLTFTPNQPSDSPTWRYNSGRPYIEFSGGNDNLKYMGGDLYYPQPTAFVRVLPTSGSRSIFHSPQSPSSHSSPYFRWSIWGPGGGSRLVTRWNGSERTNGVNGAFPVGNESCVGISPSDGKLFANGATYTSSIVDPITYPNSGGVWMGVNSSYGEDFYGNIYGAVLFNRAPTESEITLINEWNAP